MFALIYSHLHLHAYTYTHTGNFVRNIFIMLHNNFAAVNFTVQLHQKVVIMFLYNCLYLQIYIRDLHYIHTTCELGVVGLSTKNLVRISIQSVMHIFFIHFGISM